MRAGLGAAGRAVEAQVDGEAVKRRLIATVAVMTQQAGRTAYRLCMHARRSEVTKEDVNAALMHQARHFLQTVDSEPVVASIVQMEHEIFGGLGSGSESSGSSGSSESDTDDDAADAEVDVPDATGDGDCGCAECVSVREAASTWAAWDPVDDAEKYLRNAVNNAIAAASAHPDV